MTAAMVYREFAQSLKEICSRCDLVSGRPLLWTIIINPKAGGFTIKSRWKKHSRILAASVKKAANKPVLDINAPSLCAIKNGGEYAEFGLVTTNHAGHAGELARELLKEAATAAGASHAADSANATGAGSSAPASKNPVYLIITAGGDGTSLEVLTALFHAPKEVRENFIILRLPMGTGNDGSDSRNLDEALDLLIEKAEVKYQRAISLGLRLSKSLGSNNNTSSLGDRSNEHMDSRSSGGSPNDSRLAFNILSVGLDAFVTHMTNKMKGKLPGDSYKLWVDIAALFYDKIYHVDKMEVSVFDEAGNKLGSLNEKFLLMAMGESGCRTYGANKKILPDERNICCMRQMPLFRKFFIKGLMSSGAHVNEKEAVLFTGSRMEIKCNHPILAQMDGETILLEKDDFPIVIELTDPVIPIIKKLS